VGPGDSTCFYLQQSISSVKGYFRGHVEAKARTVDGKADIPLVANSNQSNWSDNISVKSSEKDNNSRLWVKLQFPDRPDLADQQLDCQIRLNAEYPKIDAGGKSFHLEQRAFDDQLAVALGPPHCGSDYRSLWWGATLGGMGLLLLSGGLRVWRAVQLKKQALPTAAYTIGEPENEDPFNSGI